MKQALLSLLFAVVLLVQSSLPVAALTLDTIGAAQVTGNIASFSYMGAANPVFRGTTDPSTPVSIDIQGITNSVTSDGAGAWSYTPTTVQAGGSYPVMITSGSETISFTLNISSTLSGDSSATAASSTTSTSTTTTTTSQPVLPDELPQTGTAQETLLLVVAGVGLVIGGVLFYWKVVPGLLFADVSEVTDEHVA